MGKWYSQQLLNVAGNIRRIDFFMPPLDFSKLAPNIHVYLRPPSWPPFRPFSREEKLFVSEGHTEDPFFGDINHLPWAQ